MRKLLFISIIMLTVLVLFSCGKKDERILDIPSGYTCEKLTGGSTSENVNIKTVSVEQQNSFTQVKITFLSGSEINGSGETALSSVPEYALEKLSGSYDIILNLKSVSYTDFERDCDITDIDEILGVFFDEVADNLTFQFKNDMAYNVKVDMNTVIINFAQIGEKHDNDDYAYFITSNTYPYYEAGIFTPDELYPTLTRTGEKIFISKAFDSEEEVKNKLDELKKKNPLYERSFDMIAKYYSELPIYDSGLDNSRVYSEKLLRQDGVEKSAEVYMAEGFYWAQLQIGSLYEKFIFDGDCNHSEVYIKTADACKQYLNFEFESIEKMAVSPDEKKLAVLENSSIGSHLYIFDAKSTELLYDLSDSGLGKRISDFVWNDIGNAIYSVSGTDKISIYMYDFSVNDEMKRTSVIYTGEVDECCLELYEGELYYINTDENGSAIYKIRPEIGIMKEFSKGSKIKFGGDYAAVSTASTVVQSGGGNFYIVNMQTGEQKNITSDFCVYDFIWSLDGKAVYYVENRQSEDDAQSSSITENDSYPYTVYKYDLVTGKSEKLCDVKYYNRLMACDDGLMLMYYNNNEERILFAGTYLCD